MGTRTSASNQCVLGRCYQGVPALAQSDDGQDLSAPYGSGVGVCGAQFYQDGLFLGQRRRQEPGELLRLWQPMGQKANCSGWLFRAEWVWSVRYARQRMGVGSGLLYKNLRWRSVRR